ncbi:MAG: ABC transporter permease, partial [Flavisolibacter sp.]
MVRNYLKTALRNLLRYKGFALINIASLSIGIVGCLVIGLFVFDERQYDKNIPGGENIYRIYEEYKNENATTYGASVAPAYAPFLKQQYPEVDQTVRILMTGDKRLLESGEKRNYEDKGWFVDPSFFQVFPMKLISGNPLTALSAPNTVVISEDVAKRFFGNEDALNKTIKIDKVDYAVKGVMEKFPTHFHLSFRYIMSLESAGLPQERMEKWSWHQFYT